MTVKKIDPSFVRKLIPERPDYGHKGTFGHLLILGGSKGYAGAGAYCTAKGDSSSQ